MCDRTLDTFCPPSNLVRNEISILKILKNLQTSDTPKCVENEWETDTARGKSSTCFQFCKHCIAQLDSVLAANPISTSLPSAFSEVIPNSNLASAEVCGGRQNSNCDLSSFCSGPIPSQEFTESNSKLLMFLKLVSAAFSLNSLTETEVDTVDSTTSEASLHTYGVLTSTNAIEIAHYSATQQFGEDTIIDANSTYCSGDNDDKIETDVNIEASSLLNPATSTSSQLEALLDHDDYNAYDNTTIYTLEDLFPEPEERSYIFPNYKQEIGTTTVTATAAETGTVNGLGSFQLVGTASANAHAIVPSRGLVLSCQPSSISTLEQPALANITQCVAGRSSNQNLSCYDARLPLVSQEVEISLLGPASAPQSQLPPMLSLDNVVPKIKKSTKQELTSSTEKASKTLIVIGPISAKVKKLHGKREKNSNNGAIPHVVVSHNLPQNQTHSCKSCSSEFSSKYLLSKHTKMQHKAFACKYCNQCYHRAKELWEHKLNCAFLKTKKIYTCQICSKQYLWKESMKRHERAHSGIKSYKCDKCGRSYYERYDLLRHHRRFANCATCVGAVQGRYKANSTARVSNDAGTVVDATSMSTVNMVKAPSEATSVQSSSPDRERESNEEVKSVGITM